MKRVSRAQLRGKPLDEDCKRYGRSESGQFGPEDKRCYCSGIWNPRYDEFDRKCFECKAWDNNAEPVEEGE